MQAVHSANHAMLLTPLRRLVQIKYIWGSRLSPVKVLYFIIRYFTIIDLMWVLRDYSDCTAPRILIFLGSWVQVRWHFLSIFRLFVLNHRKVFIQPSVDLGIEVNISRLQSFTTLLTLITAVRLKIPSVSDPHLYEKGANGSFY